MARCATRVALSLALAAVLAASATRVALAVDERVWLSLETGADLYDPEQALRDGPAFGLRATGFLNHWVGVEGLYHRASPHQDPTTLGDAIYTHYGAGLIGKPRDTDSDGVPNKKDRCPDTSKGAVVDATGCPLDTDGDKVFDGLDKCANTPRGAVVDASGCPLDADQDGVFDGIDKCDNTPK